MGPTGFGATVDEILKTFFDLTLTATERAVPNALRPPQLFV